ncbi:MAG: C-GCAxxG-C-C family protein [Saccharofermentanales bacterium]
MSEKVQKARELHESGFNCSQSVLGSFCDRFGIDEQILMKLACGFGGGIQCGEVCGAVSGAIMVVGLKYGQSVAGDQDSKKKCYEITLEFMEEYSKRKGTVLCRELLGYDIRDAEAKAKFPDRQKQICPKAIETAVLILEEMGF